MNGRINFRKITNSKTLEWFIIFLLSLLASLFIIDVIPTYSIRWRIFIAETLSIDMYGAVIPTTISSIFLILCLARLKFSITKYTNFFLLSAFLTLIFTTFEGGSLSGAIYSQIPLVVIVISFLVVVSVFGNWLPSNPKKLRRPDSLEFSKRRYILALLVVSSCTPLSVLIVDVSLVRVISAFVFASYIGGAGLADGIMLSFMLAPVLTTLVTAALFLACAPNLNGSGIINS